LGDFSLDMMPEMDGYALAVEIRRIEDDQKRPIPHLAIAASEFDLNKERAKSNVYQQVKINFSAFIRHCIAHPNL
jgi:CheY-like chemotaxis protein